MYSRRLELQELIAEEIVRGKWRATLIGLKEEKCERDRKTLLDDTAPNRRDMRASLPPLPEEPIKRKRATRSFLARKNLDHGYEDKMATSIDVHIRNEISKGTTRLP